MTDLHIEVYGQGEVIVMLHGWAMHTGIWRDFAQLLATEYQVRCMDLPGHGRSANITPYTLESIVDAIHAQLPEKKCMLLGWSLGGNVALRLAEKYPQRIKSLMLVASNPRFTQSKSWPGVAPQNLQEFADNLQANPVHTLLRFMSLQVLGKPDAKSMLKQIKLVMQESPVADPGALQGGLRVLQTIDQRETIRHLALPVLMVFGGLDTLVPVSVAKECQLLSERIETRTIDGAGHIPFFSEQQQLLALLQDFILRNARNGRG
ncbi:pimeloyl-ACP methyl ester esterase BioH [Methyloprofundus sp.]|uniref:pimeloyl-ACP methyl ester esterase BioH n=1 Tax=Methyloprofundus sp. TaxID=2020875 RepID=UPI003D0EB99B